ncbi:uncharacterized protein LOC107759463 isoform X2 [Nicotiana tabacum]|uniref:Uncharacterized protein isoform X2 n=2 Tax=Nicotiana tabacum TaxID=4097 RepID=A0A1S3WZD7_TOBAC|nr:PREDICTED: uncharacterized protein LOC107759463 isoform X2 [Nicotiana tabacum]
MGCKRFFQTHRGLRNEKGDALSASYYHIVSPLSSTAVGTEVTHSFSTNKNAILANLLTTVTVVESAPGLKTNFPFQSATKVTLALYDPLTGNCKTKLFTTYSASYYPCMAVLYECYGDAATCWEIRNVVLAGCRFHICCPSCNFFSCLWRPQCYSLHELKNTLRGSLAACQIHPALLRS